MVMNSIVIPVFCEENNRLFPALLAQLKKQIDCQVILVDGSPDDRTAALIEQAGLTAHRLPQSHRAARLNAGLALANGEMVLLHHPRSIISQEGLNFFAKLQAPQWGGFTHQFDRRTLPLRFTSWYSNQVRATRGIIYLDHCIFAPRTWLVQVGGVPDMAIFEDTVLSQKLMTFGKPYLSRYHVTTSAIRFEEHGFWPQAWRNLRAKWSFYWGTRVDEMDRQYEQGLHLNSARVRDADSTRSS